MTWFDFLLMAFMASLIALGVKRQMGGLLVGVGAMVLFRVLIAISTNSRSAVAIAFALIAGLILGLFGLKLNSIKISELFKSILGGFGGVLLGILMLLAIITSLPLGKNINDQFVYPSQQLPRAVRSAVQESYFVDIGRNILLFPLLEKDNHFSASSAKIYRILHNLVVVVKPWEKEL